jgi:hypothetical protein
VISGTMTAAEFRLVLSDSGVPVVSGSVNTLGLIDSDQHVLEGDAGFAGSAQMRGEVVGSQLIVTVLTDDFAAGALAIDTAVTVNGTAYVIRLALAHSHVALNTTTLYLGKVAEP